MQRCLHKNDIGAFNRYISAAADCNAYVRSGQRRGVVDAVADEGDLGAALSQLLSLLRKAVNHNSLDMRKATLSVLTKLHFVLGDQLDLSGVSDRNRRAILEKCICGRM